MQHERFTVKEVALPLELEMVFEVKWVTKEYSRLPSKKQFFCFLLLLQDLQKITKETK